MSMYKPGLLVSFKAIERSDIISNQKLAAMQTTQRIMKLYLWEASAAIYLVFKF